MKSSISTATAAGKFLGKVAAQHGNLALRAGNAPHSASSALTHASVKKIVDENGNSFFCCDKSEVEGDDVVIG